MDRRRRKGALAALVAPLAVMLALAGCTPEPSDAPYPGPTAEASPTDQPTTEGDEPSAPSTTSAPEDDPTATATEPPEDESDDPADEWQPPADPTAQGPTEAPELPEVSGELDERIALPTDAVVSLVDVSTTTVEAETPGEYSGPAVVVTVEVANESAEVLDLDSAVVSLSADDGEVGVPTWSSPFAPFEGAVPAGESAEGTYVFMLDPASGRSVTVRVNYSAGEPLAVFAGQTS